MSNEIAWVLAISTWCGVLLFPNLMVSTGLILIMLIIVFIVKESSYRSILIFFICGMTVGFLSMFAHSYNNVHSPYKTFVDEGKVLTARIKLLDDYSENGVYAKVISSEELPNADPVKIWFQSPVEKPAGTILSVVGKTAPLKDSFGEMLSSRGVVFILKGRTVSSIPPQGFFGKSTAYVHARVESGTQHLDSSIKGLLLGLSLGDDSALSEDDEKAMLQSGLSHLTAVSGSNIALIVGFFLFLGWMFAIGRQSSRMLALFGVWWFVWLVRADASVIRAASMATLVLGAGLLGRFSNVYHALAITIFGCIILDPFLAVQAGFSLSVFATLGVLLGIQAGRLIEQKFSLEKRLYRWMISAIFASAGANISTVFVLLIFGLDLSPTSPYTNLLAVPIAEAGQIGAVITTVLSIFYIPAAILFSYLMVIPLKLLLYIAHIGTIPIVNKTAIILNIIIIFLVLMYIFEWLTTRYLLSNSRRSSHSYKKLFSFKTLSRRKFVSSSILISVLSLPFTIRFTDKLFHYHKNPLSSRFITLNIGQGDAHLIGDEKAGWILLDTGFDSALLSKHLSRLKISVLEAVIITHSHKDHCGALFDLAKTTKIKQLILSPAGVEEPVSDQSFNIRVRPEITDIPILEIAKGDTIYFGSIRLDVLSPVRDIHGLEANNASLVMMIVGANGVRILTTGDVEKESQWRIEPEQLVCDVLKVPHHGGNTNTQSFIGASKAKIAIISCGQNNEYGHPHKEVLAQLNGMVIHRTDLDGNCVIEL